MALVKGPYSVAGNIANHDPLAYKKITGTYDFPDDHVAPKKKWFVAIKGAPNAHASIVVDAGTITGITVAAGGSGYPVSPAPVVTFTGGGGAGAAATATVSNGVVTAMTLSSAGSGYTSAPTVTFTGGGTGATATATINVGYVTGVTITAGGSGYITAPTVAFTGGGGSGAAATATISNGVITAFTLNSAGSGYATVPTVTIAGPAATGTATIANGAVTGVTITAGGSGYTTAPTVTFSGGAGSGATATSTISGGVVTAVTITAGGSGYTSAPTVAFSAVGSGGRATLAFTAGKAHVDASAAKAVPGVKGVFWFENITSGFSSSWTNYGVAIAAVCADDWDTAEYACTLIKIEYNVLPVVGSIAQIIANPTTPLSGKQGTALSNIVPANGFTRPSGAYDDAKATAASDKIIGPMQTGWYRTMQHNPVQPKTAMVYKSGEEWWGWYSSQGGANSGTTTISGAVTGGSARNCHQQAHSSGGGFGDGESTAQASLAARISDALNGHPVVLKLSRNGHNHIGSRQYDTSTNLTFGVKNDGTLVMAKGDWNGGLGGANAMWPGFQKTYRCPWVNFTPYTYYYNAPGRGAWRCVSDEPGSEGWDIALDHVAAALNMDPWDFRQKNLQGLLERDQDNGNIFSNKAVPTLMQKVYDTSSYATKKHAPGKGPARADGRLHGIAIIGRYDAHGGVSGGGRYGHVILGTDGIAKLYHGSGCGSTGPQAAMMNVTAEVMGLAYSDVVLVAWADSDLTYTAGGQNGSAHTGGAGSAYYMTALDLRQRVFARAAANAAFNTIKLASVTSKATATATVAGGSVVSITITNGGAGYSAPPIVAITGGGGSGAVAQADIDSTGKVINIGLVGVGTTGTQIGNGITGNVGDLLPVGGTGYTTAPTVTIYDVTPVDLDAANSIIFLKSDPTKNATYASICSGWSAQASIQTGWASSLKWAAVGDAPIGSACNTSGAEAACAEVLVDPETGDVEILGYWNAVEVGTTLSKVSVDKEMGSGCEAALGQALFYGDVYDPNTAAVLQMAHGCYHHPTSLDFDPSTFHIYDVQSFDPAGPLGAHGMSEPASGCAAVIQCAIYNATNNKFMDPKSGSCSQDVVLASL